MDYKANVKEIVALIDSGASPSEIVGRAKTLKVAYQAEYYAMVQAMGAIDGLVTLFFPDPSYYWGIFPPAATTTVAPAPETSAPRQPSRRDKALDAAKKLAVNGEVTAKMVAEQLQRDGDGTPIRNLTVSVGNILARSGDWEIVSPGTYRLRTAAA